jgi:hypothetical protein
VACVATPAACGSGKSVGDRVRAICLRDSQAPQTELRELRAIGDERVVRLARALGDAVEDMYWLHVAAASGDSQLGMSATNLGNRAAARVHAAALALGTPECG